MDGDGGESCRNALRGLRRDWPAGTEVLVLEVHDHGELGLRDLIAYPMSRSGDQVGGDHQVVGRDCRVPEATETIDKARTAAEFVAACWVEVGVGTDLPAYVAPHDNWESFDVRARRWVDDTEVYES